ncbi:MAG: protein NO VEIN domain-containing protein, partial [Hassallia sp.]
IGLNFSQERYKFQNIIFFPHREYLSNYDFAKRFWEYINFHWNDLKLGQKSIVFINNTPEKVDSVFKFSINHDASIPCNDGKSHSSSEGIYSSPVKKIVGDTFLVASCNLQDEIEQFIGLKQQLNLQDCLKLLDDIAESYHDNTSKEESRLNLIYEQLLKCIREGLNDDDRKIIIDWMKAGKLLACNEQFYSVSQLYYLDVAMELPPKRNPHLVKFPGSDINSFEFEEILTTLGIRKISWDDMQFDLPKDAVDDSLPNLIKERAIFIGIFLNGSRYPELENKIKLRVENLQFYNPSKIVITCEDIDYKESIPNYYEEESNSIYYVRKWNSIKNINLGDYLIDALALDTGKISSQVLLKLLDDDIEDVIDYLLESGCNIEGIPYDNDKQSHDENKNEPNITSNGETEATQGSTSNVVPSPDGTGSNIHDWGKWGEDEAQKLYERLGYNAQKQDDLLALGYDFICTDYKRKKLYSEIKTISSSEPMVRLKQSQWRSMCSDDKKDNYELVIVVHEGHSLIEIIRVSSAWATLKNLLSQLAQQYTTEAEYTKQVEVLLGFQQNSKHDANEIIFNWQRLLKSINHSHINIYPQGIVDSES